VSGREETWEKLCDGLPCDIVFCDIEMPRMDGLELLSRMQKDPKLSHLPIAMLTSGVQTGTDKWQVDWVPADTLPNLSGRSLLDAAQRMLR